MVFSSHIIFHYEEYCCPYPQQNKQGKSKKYCVHIQRGVRNNNIDYDFYWQLSAKDHHRFQMAYATVLKAHMSALKKREKKDKKEKKPATVVQPQPS